MPQSWIDDLDSPTLYDAQISFLGGQYSNTKARLLDPDQLAKVEDCEVSLSGQISSRFGTTYAGGTIGSTSTTGPTAIGQMNAPSNIYDIAFLGGLVYQCSAPTSGGSWSVLGGTLVFNPADIPCMVQGNNKMYFAGGGTTTSGISTGCGLIQWDGTTATNIQSNASTTAPVGSSILLWHNNRLVAAGPGILDPTGANVQADSVYFSDILDATTWGATKSSVQLRVGAGDGLANIALVQWIGFNIAVFKRSGIYVIGADPQLAVADMPIETIDTNIGCVARRSAVKCGDDVLFLSLAGVQSLKSVIGSVSQSTISVPISFPIQDIIDRINWGAANVAAGVYWRGTYLLAIPIDGSSVNNYIIGYNITTGKWRCWTGLSVNSFAVHDYSGNQRLIMGMNGLNRVVEYLDYINPSNWVNSTFQKHDGTDIQPHFKTRAFVFGDALSPKVGLGAEVEINNSAGALTVTPILDEISKPSFSIGIPSGGVTLPLSLPITIPGSSTNHPEFDLMRYGEFREVQLDFLGTGTGRKEIRQIALAALPFSSRIGSSDDQP